MCACHPCAFRSSTARLVIYGVLTVIALVVTSVLLILNRGLYMAQFATPIVNSDIWDMELKWLSGVGELCACVRACVRVAVQKEGVDPVSLPITITPY